MPGFALAHLSKKKRKKNWGGANQFFKEEGNETRYE